VFEDRLCTKVDFFSFKMVLIKFSHVMMYCVLSNYNRWHISCLRGVFGKLWGWAHL